MKPIRILLVGFLLLFGGNSCKDFDLNNLEFDLILNMDIIKTNFEITFLDPVTNLPIGESSGVTVRITVFGPDSQWVLDPSGNRYSEYTAMSGRLVLSLDPYEAKPSEEDPVIFVLQAEAEGYMPISQRIETTKEGGHNAVILMVQNTNPPSGSDIKRLTNAGNADKGQVTSDIDLTTDLGTASIHLAKGTRLTDHNGNPLQGSLDISLANFNAGDNGSRQAFPGGFIGWTDSSGILKRSFIESAAFFNLTISDAQKRLVHRIDEIGLLTTVKIDPSVTNLLTGQPVQPGDDIPIYSYDEYKGQWNFEGISKVRSTPEGLACTTLLPHLSWYNFGWNHNITSELFVFSSPYSQFSEMPVKYKVKFSYYRGGIWMYYAYLVFEGRPAPATMQYMNEGWGQSNPDRWFRLYNYWMQGSMMDFINLDNTCGSEEFAFWNTPEPIYNATYYYGGENPPVRHLTIVPKYLEDPSCARINVRIICSDTKVILIPTQQLYARYRELGSTCWNYRWVNSGRTLVYGIRPSTTYELQVAYNNRWEPSVPYQYLIPKEYRRGTQIDVLFEINMKCR